MPYIVTTRHGEVPRNFSPRSRRAVATPHAAAEIVSDALDTHGSGGRRWAWSIESGGTVGPLPDGTVIEVEQVDWETLWRPTGMKGALKTKILAAFNALEQK